MFQVQGWAACKIEYKEGGALPLQFIPEEQHEDEGDDRIDEDLDEEDNNESDEEEEDNDEHDGDDRTNEDADEKEEDKIQKFGCDHKCSDRKFNQTTVQGN